MERLFFFVSLILMPGGQRTTVFCSDGVGSTCKQQPLEDQRVLSTKILFPQISGPDSLGGLVLGV